MKVVLAATQMECTWEIKDNISKAKNLIKSASSKGANIILIQELFQTPYFGIEYDEKIFSLAKPFANNEVINEMAELAKQLNVVLPISYFEVENNAYYNAIAIIDADGKVLGNYRKSHIPDGPGYLEKYYFNPGDTGFKVWNTKFGKIGVGICWDQWFPEAARIMALKGAEVLLYPTAIGDEPKSKYDSSGAWQRVMQGHAAANVIPVVASNRIGTETVQGQSNGFYGSSFICDRSGSMLAEASRDKEEVITAEIDIEDNHLFRRNWGIFRDRRIDLYKELLTLDGYIKD
ncbi:MAG: N-carbamoyl-D-amino acid hydrolase [Alphaproteobacteria bacterium MarineAlpha5_Bin11]|nr:MAG: N-carbamoyl-D-amino acid hydrolase [Alphaproteobacteria bacterium MarineAlpha5_Bin11]PPR51324.1 MAG: N-carbamoyl-D-amino acid hydrolase [Alphaproteobacteria bacterium MarineAlpha5_Bin10]|tara:strand:- start:4553 stop:5422 length:870 start_codon:yes stop_codon:yes gene_type:complete